MKSKEYDVLQRAVGEGAVRGLHRFYKHRDDLPDAVTVGVIADTVAEDVMSEICEWFEFDSEPVPIVWKDPEENLGRQ